MSHISRRGHRNRKAKQRNVSIKFSAKNFVNARELGEDVEEFYDIQEKIGEGGFGEVFKALHKKTGAERAVKVIYKTESDDFDFEKVNTTIRNEFAVVKSLDHPNMLKQYEMFEDEDKFMIVTDLYMGGELLDELEAIGCFQEDDAALLLNHMLTCVNYIHQNNLAHRDLKPENILLEASMKLDDIKVIDFGLAQRTVPGVKFKEYVGTSYYMSPQIVKQIPYTNKCDVWSCGVICFLVLGGYAPFDGDEVTEICDRIEEGNVVFDDEPDIWESVSDEAKEFICFLLASEEEDRPTAFEALQHPWLKKGRDETRDTFRRSSSAAANVALGNMEGFDSDSKLKQATYALIASQLLLKNEKDEIDEVFRVLDVDCSGRLSKTEVKYAYRDFYEKDLSDEDVDVIFKRVNFSGSGHIEYSEFVIASLMSKNLIDDKKLSAAFAEFDIDGNGFIDADELKSVLVVNDDMNDYVLHKIIKQVDKDGDGQISFEEFKSMMYITASQPTKDKRTKWGMRQESGGMLPDHDMDASVASAYSQSHFSLKSIAGASGVLSIFDVDSNASMMLDFDHEPTITEGVATMSGQGGTRTLSNMSGAIYSSERGLPSFRKDRSLPTRIDTRKKCNYSMSSGSLPLFDDSDSDSDCGGLGLLAE